MSPAVTTMAAMAVIIITTAPSTIITAASPSPLVAASTTGNDSNVASRVSRQNTARGQAGGVEHENRNATHRV
jgi:hypothetical protein